MLAGCRGAPERSARPGSGPPSASEGSAVAVAALAPAGAPPGDDRLTAPPKDVASQVTLKEIGSGFERPVLLTFAPGDPKKRLFVVEQRGAIRILENGKPSKKPFFSIKGLSSGNEEGLIGLAFHPEFAKNGKLYVNYTSKDMDTHVVEYKVSATDPDVVDVSTRRELFTIDQPYSNHNGGHLEFGPDGKLYTGMGDGGAANDPHGNGQNDRSLLAKLLRIDVDAPDARPEIVHKGLRNPWRFSFDRKTGDLYIGDVGQNLWEYVHAVRAGDTAKKNFGWNIVEGTHCFDADSGTNKESCDRTGLTPPLVEYPHEQGCSITGGRVYRGTALPVLDGRYFYADYCTGLLRSFVWTRGVVREHWDWKPAIDVQNVLTQISSFGTDPDGELYVVELTGSIYQLVPAG
ncbi:MAG: glucose dehydrogenase [Kofleriaceae bacterium]|nr:glucose dehydrogenase [Kofleriaceae bacterium]